MSLRGKGEFVTVVGKIKNVNTNDNSFTIECDPESNSLSKFRSIDWKNKSS
jgi:hypothetical protein